MPRPKANPPNPYDERRLELDGPPPWAELHIHEQTTKSALVRNASPDVAFEWGVNPYRGCFHACAYCYARPSHQYLGFGAGTDFDREIIVKTNIAARLRRELGRPSWRGAPIAFSGNTDCYQPVEARYRLTRECLKVCRDYRNPVGIITKSTLIQRDIPLLQELDARAQTRGAAPCRFWVSIPFADERDAKAIEANAPPPEKRFQTIRALHAAGLSTGVLFAPLIPGLNDHAIPEVLTRARAAGATMASFILLRLPREVRPVFEARLREAMPLRSNKIIHALEACRGGKRTDSVFGARMHGEGPRWEAISALFHQHRRRLGFERTTELGDPTPPVTAPPTHTLRKVKRQLELFPEP